VGQPGDVASPVFVAEYVEQPAVDHAVEPPVEVGQGQGVHRDELGVQATLLRLPAGLLDGGFEEVDAQDVMAPPGEEQGVLARAAARIQDVARHPIGGLDEHPLWPADVPGRLPGIGGFESLTAGEAAHDDPH
jgi:hypothetical protein